MKSIGILGSHGFLGQHLIKFFAHQSKRTIKLLSFEGDIRKQKQVENFVKKCDLVVNLAGVSKAETDQEIIETNIVGTINVINACYAHKKGFLTCVERKLTNDAFSASKNVQKSIVSEYNKLGFQGFLMKLDPVLGSREYYSLLKQNERMLLELADPADVCKWIYSFSDAFLTNGVFYTKEFEFWNPIRISVKDLKILLNNQTVENVSWEHAHKILECHGKNEDV